MDGKFSKRPPPRGTPSIAALPHAAGSAPSEPNEPAAEPAAPAAAVDPPFSPPRHVAPLRPELVQQQPPSLYLPLPAGSGKAGAAPRPSPSADHPQPSPSSPPIRTAAGGHRPSPPHSPASPPLTTRRSDAKAPPLPELAGRPKPPTAGTLLVKEPADVLRARTSPLGAATGATPGAHPGTPMQGALTGSPLQGSSSCATGTPEAVPGNPLKGAPTDTPLQEQEEASGTMVLAALAGCTPDAASTGGRMQGALPTVFSRKPALPPPWERTQAPALSAALGSSSSMSSACVAQAAASASSGETPPSAGRRAYRYGSSLVHFSSSTARELDSAM